MLGAWEIAKMEESSLPEMVATGFDEATKNIKGAEYRPVLLLFMTGLSGSF